MSELKNYKCPNCGGTLEFNSKIQKMKCPFCDTEFDMDDFLKSSSDDLHNQDSYGSKKKIDTEAAGSSDELENYICASCGGQIVVPKSTGASSCPFCGNPQVMPHNFEGNLKPDFILPFKLDKKACKERYFAHLKGKHFLPAVFKEENHISQIQGVYVPYWLFDSHIRASMLFKCERIERFEDSQYSYIKHNYFDVIRQGEISFSNVPADGSRRIADDLMESIEPFDVNEVVEYNPAYLSGYMASRYDVPHEEVEPKVVNRMDSSTVEEFSSSVLGFNRVSLAECDIRHVSKNVKYGLFPVWLLNTTWKGERFVFAMNAQTGRFVGNLPRDDAAFYRAFGLYSIILSVICTILVYVFMTSDL